MPNLPNPNRLYLDHAATSWPKPELVVDAMVAHIQQCGATAGRGAYESSRQSEGIVSGLRSKVAEAIGAQFRGEISFHSNGTAAINAALGGLIRDGDHVVTTAADHNSVLRPLHAMASSGKITWTIVDVDSTGRVDPREVLAAVTPITRLVAVTAASNVTGVLQPIEEIARLLCKRDSLFFVDAAQTVGYVPMKVSKWKIDALAAPGHKGMLGPLGTGCLYVPKRLHTEIQPTIFGGTGSVSESIEMPDRYPNKLESGNLNVPALAGWLASLYLSTEPTDQSVNELVELARQLYRGLREIEGLTIFGDRDDVVLPIASIAMAGLSPQDLSMILDSEYAVETRSGFHCAAKIHQAIGSGEQGTLRISAGHGTTEEDIVRLLAALRDVAAKMGV